MNIELQNTGNLTATVKIDLTPADYEEKVLRILKDYQRKASMPGFRPGKVPFGLTKKMYGQAVTADEINKMLGESLETFIKEQNLNILGNPLANVEKTPAIDWNEPGEMSFYFDLGLYPQFEVKLDALEPVTYYNIQASDDIARKYMDDLRKRNGEPAEVETSEKGDLLKGTFAELDEAGNVLEGGISSEGTINAELFGDETISSKFAGISKGAVVNFKPMEASGNASDVVAMLGIAKEQAESLTSEFAFTVNSITRMQLAEINSEFFEKVYPGAGIETEEAMIERIKGEANQSFAGESDKRFFNDAVKALIDNTSIDLPDEFLKRWLIDVNQEKMTASDVEAHYDEYVNSMRWQLIENRFIRDFNVNVTEEEIRDVFRGYFRRPDQVELDADTRMRIDSIVDSFMKNKEDVRRINDQLFEQKLLSLLKEKMNISYKTLTYEEFIQQISEK